jgi:hypothetical protein
LFFALLLGAGIAVLGSNSVLRAPSTGAAASPYVAAPRAELAPLARLAVSRGLGHDDHAYRTYGVGAAAAALANPAQRLSAHFDAGGVFVRAPGGTVRLSSLAGAQPFAHANVVDYRRGALTEWWANGPLGLEQGFSVGRPLSRVRTLTVTLGGSLRPRLLPGRRGVDLIGAGGSAVLRYGQLSVSDARGRLLPAWLTLAGRRLTIHFHAAGARYPLRIDPLIENAELTAGDGATGDLLGSSVAVSGSTIVVGAIRHNNYQGAVYVFAEPASGGWATSSTPTAELTHTDSGAGDRLGSSVAVSGSTIVAGAPNMSPLHQGFRGAAYVYSEPASGGWSTTSTPTVTLTASDGVTGDEFGTSVAVSGSTIAVGTLHHGAVYVFSKPGSGGWPSTQTAELTASDSPPSDALGFSVAVSGATIAAGAPGHTPGGGHPAQGAVYVFSEPTSGGWVTTNIPTAELTSSEGAENDELGRSVAVSGSTIAAGDPFRTVSGQKRRGAVYVFSEPASGGWVTSSAPTAELTSSEGAAGDELGSSVAVSGPTIVAGAPNHTIAGHSQQGAAYVFAEPASGGWATSATPTAVLTAADGVTADRFGFSVAMSESTIDVGSPYRTPVGGQSQQGATYVFGAPGPPTGTTSTPTTTSTSTTTSTPTTTPTYNPPPPTPLPVRPVASQLEKDVLEVFSGLGFAGLLKTGGFGVPLELTYPAYPGEYQLSGSASPNAIPGFAARASTAGTPPAAQARTKHAAKPVVIFRFKHTYMTAGKYTAKIHLTAAGRKLLRAAKRAHRNLKVSITLSLIARGHTPIHKVFSATLRK